MNSVIPIILGAARELAVPKIKQVLEDKLGDHGKLAGLVVEKIAEKAGVPMENIPKLGTDALQGAILDAEPETAELLDRHLQGQVIMGETIALDYQKEQWWAWGWRPAWMWLLGFLWLYQLILFPILKAAVLPALPTIDTTDLLGVTGIFITFYMGGHTAKKAIASFGR